MTALASPLKKTPLKADKRQFVTFQVGPMCLAIAVADIQEINRHLDVTPVPHSPATVHGVVNLRGHVVTVMNLHAVLGLPSSPRTRQSRNLVVCSKGELIGLWVDQILDTIALSDSDIEPPPANVQGVDGRFLAGVFTQETAVGVVVLLDQLLASV